MPDYPGCQVFTNSKIHKNPKKLDKRPNNCYIVSLNMLNSDIVPGFDNDKHDSLWITLQTAAETAGCLIVNLAGYIYECNLDFFKKCIQKIIDAGFIKLIFQCKELDFISSDGIYSFSGFLETLKPKGGDLVLLGLQPKVWEVFKILGYSWHFIVKDNLDDSINFFNKPPFEGNFPQAPEFDCVNCEGKNSEKGLEIIESGDFQCSNCKTIFVIYNDG